MARTRDQRVRLAAVGSQLILRARRRGVTGLLVTASPGEGKTTLLRDIADRAPGPRWHLETDRGAGTRAAIGRLVRRLSTDIASVGGGHRRTLDRLADGHGTVDPTTAAEAIAALAMGAAGGGPVVLTVDDLDHADDTTAAVIETIVADRATVPLAVIATACTVPPGWAGWSTRLPRLPDAEIEDLLRAQLEMNESVVAGLAGFAGGNPTVARGVATRLSPAQRSGAEVLPDPLPLPERLSTDVETRLTSVTEQQRVAILDVAVAGHAAARRTVARADLPGLTVDAALSTGMVIGGDLLSFPVAWQRDAVLQLSAPEDVRRAHRRLASRDAPTTVVHTALGSADPDDAVAERVATAADDAEATGDLVECVRLLGIAHDSAVSPELRVAFARRAAVVAILAGIRGTAARWSHRARLLSSRHDAGQAMVEGANRRGVTVANRDSLRAAMRAAGDAPLPVTSTLLVQCLVLGLVGTMPGLSDDVAEAEKLVADAGRERADSEEIRALRMSAAVVRTMVDGDPGAQPRIRRATRATLRQMQELKDSPRVEEVGSAPTRAATYLGACAMAEERWDDAESLLTTAAHIEAERGWSGLHIETFGWLAEFRWRQGRLPEIAAEVRRLLSTISADDDAGRMLAAVAARAGALRRSDVAGHPRPENWIERAGIAAVVELHGLALGAAGAGEMDAAAGFLQTAAALADGSLEHPGIVWWQGDLVEALADIGETDEAAAALDRYEARAARTDTPLTRAQLLRARASLQPSGRAVPMLEQALGLHAQAPVPFERARTAFALALALRPFDAERSAGVATVARRLFRDSGAVGFAMRADQLCGAAITDASIAVAALTERGRQVAELAAAGRTNDQIASSLGLSRKTVEFHLGKVFRTLSVSRRSQLPMILDRRVD